MADDVDGVAEVQPEHIATLSLDILHGSEVVLVEFVVVFEHIDVGVLVHELDELGLLIERQSGLFVILVNLVPTLTLVVVQILQHDQ